MSSEITLRLVCHLDADELTPNELDHFTRNEKMKASGWVDADRPRDDAWTVLVAARSDKYGIADDDGILAEFPTFAEANSALTRATSEIGAVLGGLKSKVRKTTMDSISGEVKPA